MKKIILIEGLDLVGKSTLCERLVNTHPDEFIYRKGTYSDNNELYTETVKKSKLGIYSEETIAWMYIAAARHELDLISKNQDNQNDKIILQDSFFLNRMIGVHAVKDRKTLVQAIDELVKKFELPQHVFYMYADIETRQKRFMERKNLKPPAFGDKLVFEDKKTAWLREQMFRKYIKSRYNAEILDNSNMDIDELVNKVYNKIKSRNIENDDREEK